MKKFIKDLGVNALAGLLVTILVTLIGVKVVLPQSSNGNGDINSIIGGLIMFVLFLLVLGGFFFMFYLRFKLWDQQDKETAEIEKLKIKEEAEIKKLELKNKYLELQKENQQSSPKGDEN